MDKILYVDDERVNLSGFRMIYERRYTVYIAESGKEALQVLEEHPDMALLVSDLKMPQMSGLELCEIVNQKYPDIVCMILTAYPDSNVLLKAINQGGVHQYILKPWKERELTIQLNKALDYSNLLRQNKELISNLQHKNNSLEELQNRLENENVYLREEIENTKSTQIVSTDENIQQVLKKVKQVAATDTTVLVYGETGTGKELIAREIHRLSKRNNKPLITVNCATLPRDLFESELFGHKKGAFTGAMKDKKGKFELADGGTIFLDEIGEMPLELQAKLLRTLQEGEIEPVGGEITQKIDVRVISATNRNLKEEIEKKRFREDLYYRLTIFPITLPPLRERKNDISLLIDHFLKKFNKKIGKQITTVPDLIMMKLLEYQWPGNVRELENLIEHAVIISEGHELQFDLELKPEKSVSQETFLPLEEYERRYITKVLIHTGWRIRGDKGAAEILDMKPTTLQSRMKKLGITRY